MKESVCLDLEHQAARPIEPASRFHRASVVVMRRRGPQHGERTKAMFALHHRRRSIELPPIQCSVYRKLAWPTKRRPRLFVRTDVITIASRQRTVASMKFGAHLEGCRDPRVVGQDR